jgi:hypothetical protein
VPPNETEEKAKPKKSGVKVDKEELTEDDGDDEEAIHTSDAAAREEGVTYAEVEPDPTTTAHSSDAPDYEFPPGGDVDVASIEPEEYAGETPGPIPPDGRVFLGAGANIPEYLHGAPAFITNVYEEVVDDGPPIQKFDVRTRDEHNATVAGLTTNDVEEIIPGGVATRGFGP